MVNIILYDNKNKWKQNKILWKHKYFNIKQHNIVFTYVMLGVEPRASWVMSKCCPAEPHTKPNNIFFKG